MNRGNIERDCDTHSVRPGLDYSGREIYRDYIDKSGESATYNPNSDMTNYKWGHTSHNNDGTRNYDRRFGKGSRISDLSDRGLDVARQMSKGNGN